MAIGFTQAEAQTSQRWQDDCLIRGAPLGSDRRRNRYWRFLGSGVGCDGTSGRVFFESKRGWQLQARAVLQLLLNSRSMS